MSTTSFSRPATHLYLKPPLTEYLLDIATANQEWYASVAAQLDGTSPDGTSLEKSDLTKRIEAWRRDVAARTPAAHLLGSSSDHTSSECSSSNSFSSDAVSSNSDSPNPVSSAPSSTSSILRVWKRTVNTPGNGASKEAHRAFHNQRLNHSSSRAMWEQSKPTLEQIHQEIVKKEEFQ